MHNKLKKAEGKLELFKARVGIGRFTSVSTEKIYANSPIDTSTFALLLHYTDEPLPTHLLKVLLKLSLKVFNQNQ